VLQFLDPLGEVFELGLGDLVAGIVTRLDVGALQEIETLLLLVRGLRENRQESRIVAGDHVAEFLQVVCLGAIVREDEQNRIIEPLHGLMEIEGRILVASSPESVVEVNHEFLGAGEPFFEVGFGLASAFFGVELSSAGELEFAGVVEQDAFFLDVGEEVMASGEGIVDRLDGFDDQVRPGADGEAPGPGLRTPPGVGAVDDLARADDDEDIEVGGVFIGDAVLDVGVFDPVAAGIGAEQDDHQDGRALVEDDLGDELELRAFVLWQMGQRLFHRGYYPHPSAQVKRKAVPGNRRSQV